METYAKAALAEAGFLKDFVQDNHSLSASEGTLRGLHFQTAPFAQDKLVRASRGRCFDVVVDIRRASPTYGRHVTVELDADTGVQILAPAGMAHGLCTLVPSTEVQYKVTAPYAPTHDAGVFWRDPALAIDWPFPPERMILSAKDAAQPLLADLDNPF